MLPSSGLLTRSLWLRGGTGSNTCCTASPPHPDGVSTGRGRQRCRETFRLNLQVGALVWDGSSADSTTLMQQPFTNVATGVAECSSDHVGLQSGSPIVHLRSFCHVPTAAMVSVGRNVGDSREWCSSCWFGSSLLLATCGVDTISFVPVPACRRNAGGQGGWCGFAGLAAVMVFLS